MTLRNPRIRLARFVLEISGKSDSNTSYPSVTFYFPFPQDPSARYAFYGPGIPLVASSPVTDDLNSQYSAAAPIRVHDQSGLFGPPQPPSSGGGEAWKALHEFAMNSDIDKLGKNDPVRKEKNGK